MHDLIVRVNQEEVLAISHLVTRRRLSTSCGGLETSVDDTARLTTAHMLRSRRPGGFIALHSTFHIPSASSQIWPTLLPQPYGSEKVHSWPAFEQRAQGRSPSQPTLRFRQMSHATAILYRRAEGSPSSSSPDLGLALRVVLIALCCRPSGKEFGGSECPSHVFIFAWQASISTSSGIWPQGTGLIFALSILSVACFLVATVSPSIRARSSDIANSEASSECCFAQLFGQVGR